MLIASYILCVLRVRFHNKINVQLGRHHGWNQVAQLSQRDRATGWVSIDGQWVMAWVRQYSESNVVGAIDLLHNRSTFIRKTVTLRFEPLFGGLTDNIRCSSEAHWKARSGLPISDN